MATERRYSQPKSVVKKAKTLLTTAAVWLGKNMPRATNNKTIDEEIYRTRLSGGPFICAIG
jgi:hypothetical protein